MAKRTRKKKNINRRWKITIAVAGLLCLLLLGGGLFYINWQMRHPDIVVYKREYPIVGIDVSSHNGNIDFRRVASDSITFVLIKASEGADFRDANFHANYDSATCAGLKVGAYHFFRKNGDGALQAQNFLDAVAGRPLDLPLAIDVEDWGNERAYSEATVKHNLQRMIDTLLSRGRRVMIYTNKDGHRNYVKDDFSHIDLWLCAFNHPRKVVDYDWKILQYSHWGNVDGIKGEVDLNVFHGDTLQWQQWLATPTALSTTGTSIE